MIWRLPATDGPWMVLSLVFPVYYFALSLWLHAGTKVPRLLVSSMSPLVIIFITVFIDLLGFGIIIPLLPFYAESFGASAFTIGLLGTSFSLMQFLFSPIWGRWSDKIGRKPIILLGLDGIVPVVPGARARDVAADDLRRPHHRRHCRRQHPDRAGLHRRRDDAREPGEGHGHGRRGVRAGLHLRSGDRRRAEPLRPRGADVVCLGAVPGQLHRRVVPAARIAAGDGRDQDAGPAWRRSGTR